MTLNKSKYRCSLIFLAVLSQLLVISRSVLCRAADLSKFGRGDASSPAPATTLAQTQQNQTQTHHTTQQPFLNTAIPPGYSYTSLPYYTGMPGLPNTFQYGPAVFPVRHFQVFHKVEFPHWLDIFDAFEEIQAESQKSCVQKNVNVRVTFSCGYVFADLVKFTA